MVTTPDFELAASDSAQQVLEKYDRKSGKWSLKAAGPFWDTMQVAHRDGYRGVGKSIAIIDGAYDVTIPALQRHISDIHQGCVENPAVVAHGSAVALLISHVAPEARIQMYGVVRHGSVSVEAILDAIRQVRESGASIVNFSIGHAITDREHSCEVLRALEELSETDRLVVVSVGNQANQNFCPAQSGALLSAGFRSERREMSTEGLQESAFWEEPDYSQAYGAHLTFQQPDGVLGSSFAAPLLSGLAALNDDPDALRSLSRSVFHEGGASLGISMIDNGMWEATDERLELIKSQYSEALNALPHWHDIDGSWCPFCAIFAHSVLVNAGLYAFKVGERDLGEKLLRLARRLSPWSPHAAANLGRLIYARAEDRISQDHFDEQTLDFLTEARSHYEDAVAIRPDYSGYRDLLEQITADLVGAKSRELPT